MGTVRGAAPVKMFAGLLASDVSMFEKALPFLEEKFGEIDSESPVIDFSKYTSFYDREMGSGIKRKLVSFKELADPMSLADAKLATNGIESVFADASTGCRRINIDPGYIALSKLVLASVKERPHRIYIGKGIFAEITLQYRGKSFRPWEWSYEDYASDEYVSYLNRVRESYALQLKAAGI